MFRMNILCSYFCDINWVITRYLLLLILLYITFVGKYTVSIW